MHRYRCEIVNSVMMLLNDKEKAHFLNSLKQLGIPVKPNFPNRIYTKDNSITTSLAIRKIPFAFMAAYQTNKEKAFSDAAHGHFDKHYRRAKMLNELFLALDKAKIPHNDGIVHCFATFLWRRNYNDPNPKKKPYDVISRQINSVLNGVVASERDEHICLDMIKVCELIAPFANNYFQDITMKSTDYSSILAAIRESSWEEVAAHVDGVHKTHTH